ncbi:MAG: hypothetical protein ABS36_08370 [Acidobacteria bacterium SCN 69-37]|nr:MAG: hypothetical protein ABS36_08370 [Acidobacteria bacterium SCN 69-37]
MPVLIRCTLLVVLLALRLPSLVQPAGADQSLYAYIGQAILNGGAPYVDAWDQKPPGVHVLYALLWSIWPDERIVNVADLVAAVGVCWLLIVLGRRVATPTVGWVSACGFALLANPSLQRLSGVFVRAQCETFIALAVTGALVLATVRTRRVAAMAGAGVLLGCAIWLKYNAVVFALPVVAALWAWQPRLTRRDRRPLRDLLVLTAAAAVLGVIGLIWLAWHGALTDLWLATFTYNVEYSSAGYSGPGAVVRYLWMLPLRQARHELLWLLGLGGVVLGLMTAPARRAAIVAGAWIVAAVVAIALNGRDLPQYFVQATPALAFAGGVGLVAGWTSRVLVLRAAIVLLLVAGFWRIGTDRYVLGVARLGGLPGLVDNIGFDLAYARGRIDRRMYLDRFGGNRPQDKYSAGDVEDLAREIAAATTPDETILVFGFSPGVYVKAHRRSATRFFWSYPVVIEFAADRPGYGSRGLLEDLVRNKPAVVMLQKGDWKPDSYAFFMSRPSLVSWLESNYERTGNFPRFSVWQRIAPEHHTNLIGDSTRAGYNFPAPATIARSAGADKSQREKSTHEWLSASMSPP